MKVVWIVISAIVLLGSLGVNSAPQQCVLVGAACYFAIIARITQAGEKGGDK